MQKNQPLPEILRKITNAMRVHSYIFRAYLASIGCIYLVNTEIEPASNVLWLILFGILILFFQHPVYLNTPHCRQSTVVAGLFAFFLALGNGWFYWGMGLRAFSFACLSFGGVVLIMKPLLDILFYYWLLRSGHLNSCKGMRSANPRGYKAVFLGSFFFFFLVYFVFFLNIYPGSLSCDTPAQLAEALGVNNYENANPLINTLVLTVFVRIGTFLFQNVNAGVALYTLFQFTLTAFTFAYAVSSIYKKGYSCFLVVCSVVFYGLVPYNIVYATGMWKDTFFAVMFLLTIVFLWNGIDENNSILRKAVLVILSLIASLSRNSGWTSLLVLGVLLVTYGVRRSNYVKEFGMCILGGVVLSLLTVYAVFPQMGATYQGGITVGISVPLQQVSRVVATDGDIADYERELINQIVPVEELAQKYDETISDPVKWAVARNGDILQDNISQYLRLWVKLGIKNPKCYLDAYLSLTRNYWFPDSSSWVWDTRIFDNPFGVERMPILLPDRDLGHAISLLVSAVPKFSILARCGTILWLLIVCIACSSVNKSRLGMILCSPMLAIFIGLMITSPVALFRYVYAVVVCVPVLLCLPQTNNI